jgi:hypothetical protein
MRTTCSVAFGGISMVVGFIGLSPAVVWLRGRQELGELHHGVFYSLTW